MKRKIYISISAVIVVLIIAYLLFAGSNKQEYSFKFDKVTQGDLTQVVTATGTINAVTSVEVGTQVSGIVAKLYADFNSIVKRGQLIAQIDSTFLVQSVKDAEANLERANAQFTDSKRNLDRQKALLERGLESQINFDAALTSFESNQAGLKSAQAALDRAKINLAYSTIYAPIDGVVINRAVNVGQTVAASFSSPTLFTIANDLKKMQVQTTVDETDIGKISTGQEATFTVDAYAGETFRGTVSQIRLAPQSIQNVVNYIVIIDVNNDQLKLMPGLTANVTILVASANNVMRVSSKALRFQPPTDLIDTTNLGSMFRRDSTFSGRNNTPSNFQPGSQNFQGMGQFSQDDMARFRAVSDSIQAAHGKNLSREEMRNEMQKVMSNRMNRNSPVAQQNQPKAKTSRKSFSYGITSVFPEYEKNTYNPSQQSGRGRVWILKSDGKLESIFVRTGLSNNQYTEIISEKLKPGDQIVIGATSNNETAATQVSSPLSGAGGGPPRGGGFR